MKATTLTPGRRWLPPGPSATRRREARSPSAGTNALRGGLVSLLGSVYIVVLIPMILGMGASPSPGASVSATALACAVGTALFALVTRLPFAVGPGIVPASIVATFIGSGIPFGVVLGIEVFAGLLFLALAATGAIRAWVRRTPSVLKTAGQVAIGLYLLLAALRATGVLQAEHGAAAPSLEREGLLFLKSLERARPCPARPALMRRSPAAGASGRPEGHVRCRHIFLASDEAGQITAQTFNANVATG